MDEERLVSASPLNCSHQERQLYTERFFDILNGFELTFTRCPSCHKTVSLDRKKTERGLKLQIVPLFLFVNVKGACFK